MKMQVFTLFLSALTNLLIIKLAEDHKKMVGDNNFDGPQKIHTDVIPRIGGAALITAISASIGISYIFFSEHIPELLLLILCSLPAFISGLADDISKNVPPKIRMLWIVVSALMVVIFFRIEISTTNIGILDSILDNKIISILFIIFSITGLTNAYNIIDGVNGLSSMIGIITLASIGFTAYLVNDHNLVILCLSMSSALFGFFIFNYPRGLVFLGDCGAYLIGFWVATCTWLLISRNNEITIWYGLLVNIYPTIETIFTIYRRRKGGIRKISKPDGLHFHTILYKRYFRPKLSSDYKILATYKNSKIAPLFWIFTLLSCTVAILFRYSQIGSFITIALFILMYTKSYSMVVRFEIPKIRYKKLK